MLDKVFHRSASDIEKRINFSMTAKKPVTLQYIPATGEPILLAKETTNFRGVIDVDKEIDTIQCRITGENIKGKKNTIKLEINY